jgi:hypothetical protein
MAGFNYLKGKKWREITREERFFCAELYFEIKNNERDFVTWLNTKTDLNLDTKAEWEIGYEVCFYRDYNKYFFGGRSIKGIEYPQKRTFDLCLFSNETLVIIEAKAQTGFESKQVEDFREDVTLINKLLDENLKTPINIKMLGICSSKYIQNEKKYGRAGNLKLFEGKIISWNDLMEKYENENFNNADKIYKK